MKKTFKRKPFQKNVVSNSVEARTDQNRIKAILKLKDRVELLFVFLTKSS